MVADILEYWFGQLDDSSRLDQKSEPFRTQFARWYGKDPAVDLEIRRGFERHLQSAIAQGPTGEDRDDHAVTASAQPDAVTVSFNMPRGRELASLPTPSDGRVRLRAQPAGRVAALRSRRRLQSAGLRPTGPALFAGCDPPSTLPFLRRVEVWVPIA
jgi:hypothetical protein